MDLGSVRGNSATFETLAVGGGARKRRVQAVKNFLQDATGSAILGNCDDLLRPSISTKKNVLKMIRDPRCKKIRRAVSINIMEEVSQCISSDPVYGESPEGDRSLNEGVEVANFIWNDSEYLIFTPFDPLMFVSYKDNKTGDLLIADDDLLEDEAVLDAIDEEKEFQAYMEEENLMEEDDEEEE